MTKFYSNVLGSIAVIVSVSLGSSAWAVPDDTAMQTINEPTGFPGLCAAPCYTIQKSFEFWLHDNPDNPFPSAIAGENTFIYKLEHVGGSGLFFVPAVTAFELVLDPASVSAAGVIPGSTGVAPSATTIGATSVTWQFPTPGLSNGTTSALLYVHSRLLPGLITDNLVGTQGQVSLDAASSCKGPFLEPPALMCTLQLEKEGCVQQPPDVPGDSCAGKLVSFTYEYTGLGCSASSNLQNPKKVRCTGGAIGQEPVSILVTSSKRKRWSWDNDHGWWGKRHKKKTVFSAESNVHIGDILTADATTAGKRTFGSKSFVKISTGTGHHDIIELDQFHTSCSQPFAPGNQFGSIRILSVTSTEGGTVTFPTEDPADGDSCETSIDTVPAPHCLGKVRNLSLRYTGSDCVSSMSSQSSTKTACVDAAAPTLNPVRILVTNSSSPGGTVLLDQSPVSGGDIVEITNGGLDLNSTTGFWIYDAVTGALIQDGFFHTSCSQPVNLGDQFGALQVFGLDTTQGGSVSLGANVDYTYTVTNPNADPVDNVSVDDDLLGNIASGVSIAAGMTASFTTTALIEQQTTNVATVTGNVGPTVCNPATASATITVAAPTEEPTICTKKIASTLLRYTGPDILGARVEFSAKTFANEPVVYDPIDLIGGVTVLSKPEENGFSVDGTSHGETDLGSKLTVSINGVPEISHTSCSVPYETDAPAPLDDPKGAPSPNWSVVDFTEKVAGQDDHDD